MDTPTELKDDQDHDRKKYEVKICQERDGRLGYLVVDARNAEEALALAAEAAEADPEAVAWVDCGEDSLETVEAIVVPDHDDLHDEDDQDQDEEDDEDQEEEDQDTGLRLVDEDEERKTYEVKVTQVGYLQVEATTAEEACSLAEDADPTEVDWYSWEYPPLKAVEANLLNPRTDDEDDDQDDDGAHLESINALLNLCPAMAVLPLHDFRKIITGLREQGWRPPADLSEHLVTEMAKIKDLVCDLGLASMADVGAVFVCQPTDSGRIHIGNDYTDYLVDSFEEAKPLLEAYAEDYLSR